MALLSRFLGVGNNECIPIWLADSTSTTGGGKTGLTNTSTGLIIATRAEGEATPTVYTAAGSTIDTIATIGTYVAPASGHCRFKEVDATNEPGSYEIQLANARFAVTGSGWLKITVQAIASNVPVQQLLYELDNQVDVQGFGGTLGSFGSGRPGVDLQSINGTTSRATKLALEMDGRDSGTLSVSGYTHTVTSIECSDITDARSYPIYINRGFVVTSGSVVKAVGTILTDQVGTTGRRLTITQMQAAPAGGDTILIV